MVKQKKYWLTGGRQVARVRQEHPVRIVSFTLEVGDHLCRIAD
jgi:hypothetical protein